MNALTSLLRKSIAFEKSKTDVTNLLNHKEGDLSIVIDALELSMREYQHEIAIRERTIEEAEDMTEIVRKNLIDSIAWRKNQIQSLIAWRAIFFSAMQEVKNT